MMDFTEENWYAAVKKNVHYPVSAGLLFYDSV